MSCPPQDPWERIERKSVLSDELFEGTPCKLWTASKNENGYALMSIDNKTERLHRWIYKQLVGPIPDGHKIDHRCHNDSDCQGGRLCLHRSCLEPAHFEAVSSRVNILRGKGLAARNAAKIRCIRGHLLSGENLQVFKKGMQRNCRACATIRRRKSRAKKAS